MTRCATRLGLASAQYRLWVRRLLPVGNESAKMSKIAILDRPHEDHVGKGRQKSVRATPGHGAGGAGNNPKAQRISRRHYFCRGIWPASQLHQTRWQTTFGASEINSAAASAMQKLMNASIDSGDEQISDANARSCILSETAAHGWPGRNSASATEPATSSTTLVGTCIQISATPSRLSPGPGITGLLFVHIDVASCGENLARRSCAGPHVKPPKSGPGSQVFG